MQRTSPVNPHLKFATLILAAALAACSGGGGDGGTSNPPTVTSTTPINGTVSVEPTISPTVTFSQDMLNTSIDDTTILLEGNVAVSATINFDGSTQATITPSLPLALLTEYSGKVTTAVADLSGNALATEHSWNFTTRDGAWQTAQLLENDDSGNANSPSTAFDSSGNGWAVWTQSDGTRDNIWVSEYTTETGWDAPELLETSDEQAIRPMVAVDMQGNVLVVWSLWDGGSTYTVWSAQRTTNSVWSNPEILHRHIGVIAIPTQIVFDATGNALLVGFSFASGSFTNLAWSHYYTAGVGWGELEIIRLALAVGPEISIDGAGNGLAVWFELGVPSNTVDIRSSLYTPGNGWSSSDSIVADDQTVFSGGGFASISMDSSGNALAIWPQLDNGLVSIWSNRYTPAGGWGSAELLERDDNNEAFGPSIAMDAAGNGLALWVQTDGNVTNIWSNRYTPAGGWSVPELIETDNAGDAELPELAMDATGNAVAVWQQSDGSVASIWVNRYTLNGGWGTAQLIETEDAGDAQRPQVSIDASGRAFVSWFQSDGSVNNAWINQFK